MKRDRQKNKEEIQELYQRSVEGDEKALMELYNILKQMLNAYIANRHCYDLYLRVMYKEDIDQDLYESLIKLLGRYDPKKSPFVTFVYSIFMDLGNRYDHYVSECYRSRRSGSLRKVELTRDHTKWLLDEKINIEDMNEIDFLDEDAICKRLEHELKGRLKEKEYFVFIRYRGLCGQEKTTFKEITKQFNAEFNADKKEKDTSLMLVSRLYYGARVRLGIDDTKSDYHKSYIKGVGFRKKYKKKKDDNV